MIQMHLAVMLPPAVMLESNLFLKLLTVASGAHLLARLVAVPRLPPANCQAKLQRC
jgi:hypothetical protein